MRGARKLFAHSSDETSGWVNAWRRLDAWMEYKNYLAEVEVDESVTFEAENVAGLRGVEPRKPLSGKLNLRLGPTLHQQVAVAASTAGVSLNSWIVRALEERAAPVTD